MSPRTVRLLCLGVFLLTLAGQWWFANQFAVPIEDEPDGKIYLALAHNLLAHGIYSPDTGPDPAPTYLRLPGYPWMVTGVFALCGDGNLAALRGFQAFLSTLTCAGVAWLAFLWQPDAARRTRAAWIAFGLAAVCPFTAIYNATILAETLTLFWSVLLMLAATWAFRARAWPASTLRWVVAGLLAGAVQLVRPEAGLFAAAVGFTLAGFGLFGPGENRRLARLPGIVRNGAVFSCAFAAALVPWTVRNARVFHVVAPLPPANVTLPGEMDNHGFNAWYRTWADSEQSLEPYYWNMSDGEPATTAELPDRAFDSDEERARTEALFARYNTPTTPDDPDSPPTGLTPELDEAFGQLAHERATRSPWRYYVTLPLRRAVNLWFGPHATYYPFDGPLFPSATVEPEPGSRVWLPVFFALVCAYTALGLVGMWRLAKTHLSARYDAWRWLVLVVLIVVPRWVYLSTLENTEPRYMVEIFPFLSVLGGLALAGRKREISAGRTRHILLVVSVAGWLTQPPRAAAQTDERRFPPDAVVNVTLPPYNLVPDDGRDDTAVLQRAITENVGTGRVLYLPTGVYRISDTLAAKDAAGLWKPHLTLQGQSRSRTILRLADGAAGFGDPAHPKAVLMTGSLQEKGDDSNGGGNKAFRNNVWNLTIDTGKGNPGAQGVEYAVSNVGAVENVTIRSGDGAGAAGISLRRHIPGPGLISHVEIDGFDCGIDYGDIEYGMTLEDVRLRDQHKAGVRLGDNVLHVRKLDSDNRVPAVEVAGGVAALTLVDSFFTGEPVLNCKGTLLLRGLGFQPGSPETRAGDDTRVGVRWRGERLPVYFERINDWVGPKAIGQPSPDPGATSPQPPANLLAPAETPDYWNNDLTDWIPVGPRRTGEGDDTAAIQRAIDSGRGTVYFPNNRTYFLSDTVVVRGKVRQILGLGSEISLGVAEKPFSGQANPRPLFRIDPTDADTVFIENLFFNAQYPGEVIFENHSPRTLVIRHCAGWVGLNGSRRSYRNTAQAAGARVFLEDVFLPGWQFTNQRVWARQFNPENWDGNGSEPQVLNDGGELWILGFKTEGSAPLIATTHVGQTELLGAYNYISATKADPVPAAAVPYIVDDSEARLTFATDNFRGNDYAVYIREIRDGKVVRDWKNSEMPPRNGRTGDHSFAVSLVTASCTTNFSW